MAEITETRQIMVERRIITLPDVRRLAALVANEPRASDAEHYHRQVSFVVTCTDRSSFQSSDPAIFADDSVVSRKRIDEIYLDLDDFTAGKFIDINLSHGGPSKYGRNRISVRGGDSKWVNGTILILQETLDSFIPQDRILYEQGRLMRNICAIGIGSLFISLGALFS